MERQELNNVELTPEQLKVIRKLIYGKKFESRIYSKRTQEAVLQGRRKNTKILYDAIKSAQKELTYCAGVMSGINTLLSSNVTTDDKSLADIPHQLELIEKQAHSFAGKLAIINGTLHQLKIEKLNPGWFQALCLFNELVSVITCIKVLFKYMGYEQPDLSETTSNKAI